MKYGVGGFRIALDAGAEAVVQMDCDFSHQPEYIPGMVAVLRLVLAAHDVARIDRVDLRIPGLQPIAAAVAARLVVDDGVGSSGTSGSAGRVGSSGSPVTSPTRPASSGLWSS